jgi:hypothetical protein
MLCALWAILVNLLLAAPVVLFTAAEWTFAAFATALDALLLKRLMTEGPNDLDAGLEDERLEELLPPLPLLLPPSLLLPPPLRPISPSENKLSSAFISFSHADFLSMICEIENSALKNLYCSAGLFLYTIGTNDCMR